MHTHLAIITTKRILETKNRTCQNKGKYVITYVSEPQRLAVVLSTLFGDGRACLAGNNYGNFVVFQASFKFLLFLSYFVKASREPIQQSITKIQARFCRILTTRSLERRQHIRVTRELLNQTALKTV